MKKLFFKELAASAALFMFAASASAETMSIAGAETGAVYFRVSPGSDSYYSILANGTQVESIGWQLGPYGIGYNQVVYNGQVGYITDRYLIPSEGHFQRGISYYNRGLYYEARDEFNWYKADSYNSISSDEKADLERYITNTQAKIDKLNGIKHVPVYKSTKKYKIETLKSASPVDSRYTYDDNNIYYIEGNKIYYINMNTGDSSCVFDTSSLYIENTVADERLGENETSTVKYSVYVPTYLVYDKFNKRIIMDGYYSRIDKAFSSPNTNAKVYYTYDITNGTLLKTFSNYNPHLGIKCFVSKDKAILYSTNSNIKGRFIQTIDEAFDKKNNPNFSDDINKFWTVGNDIYFTFKNPNSRNYDVSRYGFSGSSTEIELENNHLSIIGTRDEYVYYLPDQYGRYPYNKINLSKINKLNLHSGQLETIALTSDDEECEVKDMSPIDVDSFIPVSDDCIIFYDYSAKAFRKLSKN